MVYEPIFRRLSARYAASLYISQTYLQGTVIQGRSLFKWFPNLPPGTVGWGFSLFIRFLNLFPGDFDQGCCLFLRFQNIPPGDFCSEVQPVYTVSEPTSRGLSARGASFLYSFPTYCAQTVSQGCSLYIMFPSLNSEDCQPGVWPVHMVCEPASRGLPARGAANL